MQLDPAGATEVLADLDALEARLTVPRIEGAERGRLRRRAADDPSADDAASRWEPHRLDGWYLGLRRRAETDTVVGEAGRLDGATTAPLLAAAAAAGADRLWLRGADADDVAAAAAAGWHPVRTLLVLARTLEAPLPDAAAPAGLRLASLDDVGADAVAGLLARAYAPARADGRVEVDVDAEPWTPARFDRIARAALAEPADLLVAVGPDDRPVGAQWLRRRTSGVGEVFNLAVAPGAVGRGVGAWLLTAGLHRLADLGHRRAILWVDAANAPARRLYARTGFVPIGRDVAVSAADAA